VSVNTFIATTGQGLARATCGANGDWSVEFMLSNHDVRCLAADPIRSAVVYAGTQEKGVLRSDDGGRTWRSAGLDGQSVRALTVSRSEPGAVYAGTKPALIFVSRDGGAKWTELAAFRRTHRWFWFSPAEPPSFTAYVQSIGLSPTDPKAIVIGIEAGAVVRSDDSGQTWTKHCSGAVRDCHSLIFHATHGDWVYESGGTGVAFSRDAGRTWRQPRDGMGRRYGWACNADPAQPEIWYVSASPIFSRSNPATPPAHVNGMANAYVYRSAGGAPWQKLGGGLPQPLDYMAYALLTDPTAPGHLYAGLSHGEVWHSTDHGDNWQKLPFNLKGIHRSLIML
jgi:photosystem II stability/assembly factor-like uncharacterized protein